MRNGLFAGDMAYNNKEFINLIFYLLTYVELVWAATSHARFTRLHTPFHVERFTTGSGQFNDVLSRSVQHLLRKTKERFRRVNGKVKVVSVA